MNMDIREYIREEVGDWDDEIAARVRFKEFSGQRSDWEPLFIFWRDLILNIARHFSILFLTSSQLKKDWFNRGGLSPLCLDHVLLIMYNEGLIVRSEELVDPTTAGRFSHFYRKEKSEMVVKQLGETHWNSSLVVTMSRFQAVCGDSASASLSYLTAQGTARYLSLNKDGVSIQGFKLSLLGSPVSSVSSLDCDVLHLIWTAEMLEQQLGVIDQRSERSRKSAIASKNSGNKNVALRHMKALKSANESREKCYTLLNRVEEVINVIANAESTKKVSEAIKIGARVIKENNVSVKEVEESLQQLEDSIDLQKQVEIAFESNMSYASVEDEDLELEFEKFELEIGGEIHSQPNPNVRAQSASTETETSDLELSEAFSNLKVVDASSSTTENQDIHARKTKKIELEAA